MSAMTINPLRNFHACALMALAAVSVGGAGCVRQVISGEDPQAKSARITGKNGKDELVVRLPWMQQPQPRMLYDDKLVKTELVFARTPEGITRYTLRTPTGAVAMVEARTKRLPNDSLEFSYEITSLPPKYMLDTVLEVKESGVKPAIDVTVNGAPVKMAPGTEVAVVQLSRDAVTKIVAIPRVSPPNEAPKTGNP
jgi:hypothetical protein